MTQKHWKEGMPYNKFLILKGWRSSRESKKQVFVALISLFILWAVFGGKHGLFALISLQREKWQLEETIRTLKDKNREMDSRMRFLEAHPELFEKVAREKLMLAKPGELVYRFDGQRR
jgi:cell division protein FtsB